jgi:hypothetical protein
VGKNLYQIANQVSGDFLVGIDVEELNPVLRKQFDTRKQTWGNGAAYPVETLYKGTVQKMATSHRLTSVPTKKQFDYVNADQFREDTWARLEGRSRSSS